MFSLLKFGAKISLTNLGFFCPYELNFAITYKCNSKCKTCYIWKKKLVNELTLNEIRKITKNLSFIQWVRLTGGEPFLRKDYVEIVKLFNENLPNLYILTTPTNGLLSDLIFKKVRKVLNFFTKRYVITVSLDGPEKIHDKIRGIKGSWKFAISTLQKLKQLEINHKNFKVFFGYTISPYNLGLFRRTIEEVKELADVTVNDFHINLFQTSDIYYGIHDFKLTSNYFKKAMKEIDSILSMREKNFDPINLIEIKYLELGKKYLKTKKTPMSCNIFNLSCFIDPQGNVYPCTVFNRKLGNLRDNDYDLKRILNSTKANKVKREILKNKCPQCWTPCEAHQLILSNWFKS
jgi:MoaA/NifB/PqqE/SkfB family radical SAM enzyme